MTTLQYILSILQIALNAAQGLTTGSVKGALTTVQALEQIIQAALAAYQQHTGQPIDPSLLQPIDPIAPIATTAATPTPATGAAPAH